MQDEILTIDQFHFILQECLDTICNHMHTHLGILRAMRHKSKFEKWLQIELLGLLIEKTERRFGLDITLEAEASMKTGKKGEAVDLAITSQIEKLFGIELKIIPTSYAVSEYRKATKAVTNGINELLQDIDKCLNDGYKYAVSIGFVFPLPTDTTHRNHRDWQKQEAKMRNYGDVQTYRYSIFPECLAIAYVISKPSTKA